MTQPIVPLPEKSTTGRAGSSRAPGRLTAALSALESASPELAAQLAMRVFFRTTRRTIDAAERALLERGERLSVETRAGALSVRRWGRGPLVLLMHGWNGSASQLGAFVGPLTASGYQVIALDAPGHGDSEGNEASIADFADALESVIDATKPLFQPIRGIIAHSMGSPATILALSRAAAKGSEGKLEEGGFHGTRVAFIAPPIDMLVTVRAFARGFGLGEEARSAFERGVIERVGLRFDAETTLAMAQDMRSPLLVVHDESDRMVPIQSGELLARAWPGARLRRTSGLGHGRVLRDPAVVQDVVEFVRTP